MSHTPKIVSIASADRGRVVAERDRLVEEHVQLVVQIARSMAYRLPTGIDVDNLIGEGNLGLLRAATVYRPREGSTFAAFAQRVIRRFMAESIRRRNWAPSQAFTEEPDPNRLACAAPRPDEIFEDAETASTVARQVGRLPHRWRTVIEMSYSGEGKKLREIAEMMDITEDRVSQIRRSALDRLRERILA